MLTTPFNPMDCDSVVRFQDLKVRDKVSITIITNKWFKLKQKSKIYKIINMETNINNHLHIITKWTDNHWYVSSMDVTWEATPAYGWFISRITFNFISYMQFLSMKNIVAKSLAGIALDLPANSWSATHTCTLGRKAGQRLSQHVVNCTPFLQWLQYVVLYGS